MAELLATMPALPLTSDCRIQFEAIDPTTGAAVAGVVVSLAVIYAVDAEDSSPPKFDPLPPLLTYSPDSAA